MRRGELSPILAVLCLGAALTQVRGENRTWGQETVARIDSSLHPGTGGELSW